MEIVNQQKLTSAGFEHMICDLVATDVIHCSTEWRWEGGTSALCQASWSSNTKMGWQHYETRLFSDVGSIASRADLVTSELPRRAIVPASWIGRPALLTFFFFDYKISVFCLFSHKAVYI